MLECEVKEISRFNKKVFKLVLKQKQLKKKKNHFSVKIILLCILLQANGNNSIRGRKIFLFPLSNVLEQLPPESVMEPNLAIVALRLLSLPL